MKKKNQSTVITCTSKEAQDLRKKADGRGLSVSAFVKEALDTTATKNSRS